LSEIWTKPESEPDETDFAFRQKIYSDRQKIVSLANKLSKEEQERLEKDPRHYERQFHYANFVCPRSKTPPIDRRDSQAIIDHKASCPWCQEYIQKQRADQQSRLDGVEKMRFILSAVELSKENITTLQNMIKRETVNKQPNWEQVVERYKKEISHLENTIESEQAQRDKLLSSDNEVERASAQAMFDKYESCTEKEKRKGEWK
jgi:hypothetical protein